MKGNDEITGLFRQSPLWCRDDGAGWLLGGAERRPVKS